MECPHFFIITDEVNMRILHEGIRQWMDTYKKNSVKPTTFDRLETSYNALLKDPIANMIVEELKTTDIQNYINRMIAAEYALSTIRKQYHLIGAYLKYACIEGFITRPIHNGVKLPTQSAVKKKKKEVYGYDKNEQERLMSVLRSLERTGYGAAILMMESGLRVGECLALKWDDILWQRRAININKTLIRITNKNRMIVQEGAKSFTSNRIIPMSSLANKLLEQLSHKAQTQDGYIFADANGKPISYEAMRYQIKIACAAAEVPYKGQHAFRHTFATNCYNRGADVKVLSKLLGHSDVSITFNVYIHLYGDGLEEMRGVVG